ncbi:MAG: alpha/beta hydrolase [Bacteroidetes bacterium]|nr:alpha/beta hydrolase [Bacteroidota bacterium]
MKKIIVLFIVLLFAIVTNAQEVTGDWAGYLSVQGVKLKIVFHITRIEGKLSSTFDSPDQNAMGLKIDETSLNGNELSLNAKSFGITYQGSYNKASDSIIGFWVQGGGKMPLSVGRSKSGTLQKQANPYESGIVLTTGSGEINGTLMLPDKTSGIPLVLIIAGSGPTDRDGNSPPALKNKSNCYKYLAEDLRKNGIATLRYDKRGIAGSTATAARESDLRFENYIADAKAWIEQLQQDKRFSKIIVAGHSEGSLIGMIACRQSNASAFISIAGSGRPADEILKEQFGSLPQETKDQIFPMLEKLKKGDTIGKVPAGLNSFFRPGIQPYLISWFKYDPASEINKLKIPVLIIQGDMDIQVSMEDARLLEKADPKAEIKIIHGMNHVLKDTDTKDKMEQIEKVYTNPDLPLNKAFEDEMVKFIKEVR